MILIRNPQTDIQQNLDIIDVIVAIMLSEETSINKRGVEDVIVGSEISKFFCEQQRDDRLEDERIFPISQNKDQTFLKIYQRIMNFISGVEQRSEAWEC